MLFVRLRADSFELLNFWKKNVYKKEAKGDI